jgi:hypothetical protein
METLVSLKVEQPDCLKLESLYLRECAIDDSNLPDVLKAVLKIQSIGTINLSFNK